MRTCPDLRHQSGTKRSLILLKRPSQAFSPLDTVRTARISQVKSSVGAHDDGRFPSKVHLLSGQWGCLLGVSFGGKLTISLL